MMNHSGGWHFKYGWLFYIWSLEFIALIVGMFIVLPLLNNGQTLSMKLLKIKIFFEDEKKITSILKREIFFSLNWIVMILLISIVINHTLFTEFAKVDQKNINYTDLEKLRIGVITSISSLLMVMQFIYAISIFVRGDKKGLHDTQSKTKTIWVHKFVEVKQKYIKAIVIKPQPVNNIKVDWIN